MNHNDDPAFGRFLRLAFITMFLVVALSQFLIWVLR
jgi:hypothetical protein